MAIVSLTNQTPATWAQAVYDLKETLKTAGWTIPSSGDGLSVYGSSSDIITTFTSGANGMDNTNAWFRLRSPDGYVEYLFQKGNDAAGQNWRILWSGSTLSGGFIGGSPSATVTPTATDQSFLRGGGIPASPTYTNFFGVTVGTTRWHIIADNAAPYGWWCGGWAIGTGTVRMGILHDPLVAVTPGDVSPYVAYLSNSAFTSDSDFSNGSSGSSFGMTMLCTASNSPTTIVSPPIGYGIGGTVGFTTMPLFQNTDPNSLTGKDEMYPVIYARPFAASSPGWKGVSTMLRWKSVNRVVTSTYTVNTTRDRVIWSALSLPWDGSIPLV